MGPLKFLALLLTLSPSALAVSPTVDLGYAKYRGEALPNGLTQWLGMRYAAPPTGRLRFEPPEDPEHERSVQLADKVCFGALYDIACTEANVVSMVHIAWLRAMIRTTQRPRKTVSS